MSQKHKNAITRQTLIKIANTMFATPANLPFLGSNELSCSHLLKRQAVPNVYFLLQFTTVQLYFLHKCIYHLCFSSKCYIDKKFHFCANMTKFKQKWCLLSLQTYLFFRQKYFLAYIYWRVVTNAYFFLHLQRCVIVGQMGYSLPLHCL